MTGQTLLSSSLVSSLRLSWENMHSLLLTQLPVVWNSLQGNSRGVSVKAEMHKTCGHVILFLKAVKGYHACKGSGWLEHSNQ